ncbi:DUF5317 domain-containing protein [Anaerofustis sp.]|uniref:DUF5317 domain-containing protein n=1 Tax=Anaerofustis sp. TaxID=1872517 RepID=UPI0025B852B9|nr:DUF5317 domain-containing protein [Anaerofustis sp.]
MFLFEIAIISIIVGLIRKGSIKNFFIGGVRGWYIFLVSIVLFMSQKILALAGVSALNDYAFWITIVAYILLFFGLFLNLEGIWVYALLIGALMNFVILVLNGGLMPVSESALSIAGLGNATGAYMTKFASTMAVANDSTIFLWKYLGAIIPLPLPSILGEVLTPGTVIMAISSFGFIQSVMTTEYMDEDEYEKYMKELSSDDKKESPLLDDISRIKEDKDNKNDISDDNDIDYTNINEDDNSLLDNDSNEDSFEEAQEKELVENAAEEQDFFADFELDDLNEEDPESEENIEDLSLIQEEGSKLEDEDLLKELEDEFNEGEEELFNEEDEPDNLLDEAINEEELTSEEDEEEIQEEVEDIPEEEKDEDDIIENIAPIAAGAGIAAAGIAMADKEEDDKNEKEPDLEDLLTEALGDDEDDEDIEELLNELRNLSMEDELESEEAEVDYEEIEENEESSDEGIDYDFFEDENDDEINEEVTTKDLQEAEEYEDEDSETEEIISKDDDEEYEELTEESFQTPESHIKDAKEILKKVGNTKSEKLSDPINPMPDVDVESPFIIADGRIVENPYYKFKKGGTSRREQVIASPEIDDNGIYVMSGGGLAKVKEGKVEPQIPKEEQRKNPVRKSNIPNMTSTPGFDQNQEEEFTTITKKTSDKQQSSDMSQFKPLGYKENVRKTAVQSEPYTPMNNYDINNEIPMTQKRENPINSQQTNNDVYERESKMTIVNDSSTGRTVQKDYNYPKEQVVQTYREPVIDSEGKEVMNPYEKVEMKIGDVEIKFWKKDNQ